MDWRILPSLTVLLVLSVAKSPVAQAQAPPTPGQQPAAVDSAVLSDQVISDGREIFHGSGSCHACHGQQLQGGPIAPSLRGPKWRHIDGTFAAILHRIRTGSDGTLMVAFPGDITPPQAIAVATYIWAVSQGKVKP